MPVKPTPSHPVQPASPSAQNRAVINDSIEVERRRQQRRREQAAGKVFPSLQDPPDTIESASVSHQADAPAPLPPPLRAPGFIPTRLLHLDLPAIEERADQNAALRMLRRITVSENCLTPEQKADAVVEWLVHNNFMSMTTPRRASQVVTKFYGHETTKSKLFESNGVFMNTNMPWLKKEQVAAIRTLLIDRVHAYKADPSAASASAQECLVRYFRAVRDGKPHPPISYVHIPGTGQNLMKLSAFHMDDVFIDSANPLAGGQQGSFFAGVTRRRYPVGVKRIHLGGDAEAKAMRQLQVGGYLQAHYAKPPAPTWVVMPCYSGTLTQLAPLFFEVPYKPRSGHTGGLRGARYILRNLLGELAFLHDEMHGLHQDIKSSNIFVSQRQKRFILGDLGLSSKLSVKGDAPFTGLTFGYAAPEQAAESQRITPAADVFSLCVTAVNGILQVDPAAKEAWADLHQNEPRPQNLFPRKEMGAAFAVWGRFSDHDDALPQTANIFELTQQASFQADDQEYWEHFNNIAQLMTVLDAPLWEALCSGMRMDPKARPAAKALQARITMSEGDIRACEAVWAKIDPYSPEIDKEIKRLTALLKQLP